jgi:predicted permease
MDPAANNSNPSLTAREQVESQNSNAKHSWFESSVQDLKVAFRSLRKSPGFAITAILTLALGIGVNASIFQLMDAVRLRSLPVADPERLASVEIRGGIHDFIPVRPSDLSYPLWEQVRDHQQAFSSVFAWRTNHVRIGQGVDERKAVALWFTGEAFNTLGISPEKGRFFSPEEDKPGCGVPGAVISHAFWQSQFGGQDSAIGSTILIERKPTRVLGVTPAGFLGLEIGRTFDFALPICSTPTYHDDLPFFTRPDYFFLTVVGRLKFGWTFARASAQLESVSPGIIAATLPTGYTNRFLDIYKRYQLNAYPAGHGLSSLDTYDSSLWLLLGITTLVLLIACANLANLMLVRGNSRQREIAVRLALGASRWRLIRQSLAEGLILAVSGAILGTLLAAAFSRVIVWFISSARDAVKLDLTLDWRVFVFTTILALLTCAIFDLWPAIRSSQTNPGLALKSGSRGTTQGRERFSFQQTLVVAQIAVSMVLLVGALLFVRSFRNLITYNPGFREDGIILARINLGHRKLSDLDSYDGAMRDLLAQFRANPGVDSVATTTHIPLNGSTWQLGVRGNNREGSSKFTWISPGYFETMSIPLLAGRQFSDQIDSRNSPHVLIVNQTFAHTFFGNDNPIGKTVRSVAEPGYPADDYQIVGVVKDTKYGSLRDPIPPEIFGPSPQFPPGQKATMVFIHTSVPPDRVIPLLRESVQQHDPDMDYELLVYQNTVEDTLSQERMMAVLSGSFGALAALLTMVGLYGVISYITSMRRNEIGIRMALGADRSSVLGLISTQTLRMLGAGVLLGILISLAATRGASSLLFGLHPNDPLSIIYAAALLVVVALLAGYIPARRASLINPSSALRDE